MQSLDRLSELPDSLIFIILSFLPMRDVVMTTFLSKSWRDLWTSVEHLDFWDENCSFINGALAQWKGAKILELNLSFHDDELSIFTLLDSLLRLAVEKQVQELNLYLEPTMYKVHRYRLPRSLYSCSSITKLSLSYCMMGAAKNVQWDRLKSLTITRAYFVSNIRLSRILCGAPLLEELNLWSRVFGKRLCIDSASLKKLQIGSHDSRLEDSGSREMRIRAPRLLTLDISGFSCRICSFDVPSLTNATLYFHNYRTSGINSNALLTNQAFRSICHVEKVTLSDRCIKFLVNMKKKDMAVEFSHAYSLKLYVAEEANEMLDVLEIFPKLMVLVVDGDHKDRYNPLNKEYHIAKRRRMMFSIPSLLQLKTVKISWSLHDPFMIRAIEIMLQNALLLEEMVFRPICFGDHQEHLLMVEEKVLSMPRSSPTAEVIVMK